MALTVAELVATLGLDDAPLNRELGQVGGRFKSAGGKLMGVAKGLAITGGAAIAGAVTTSLAMGFKRLTAIEDAEASLRGLGHSAAETKQIMDNALASVKGTAFGLDEAATVAASAVAAGIQPGKELEATLKLVGDAATIAKVPMADMGMVFNKVASAGKLSGENINQLNERGVPILQMLGKTLGKTSDEVRDMVSRGQVDFPMFAKAMEEGLGGAALDSGNTTMGTLRNVKAAMSRFGASLLQGIFPIFKDVFGGAITLLDNLTAKVGPFAERAGEALSGLLKSDELGGFLSDVGSALGDVFSAVGDALKWLGDALAEDGVVDLLQTLWDNIKMLAGELGKTLAVLGKAFADMVSAIAPLLEPLWSVVKVVFDAIVGVIRGALDIISGIIRTVLALIRGDWSSAWEGIKQATRGAKEIIVALVRGLGKLIVAALKAAWQLAVAVVRGAWNTMKGAVSAGISGVIGLVRTLPARIKSAVGNLGRLLYGAGRNVVTGLWNGISSMAGWIYDKVSGWASGIYNSVKRGLGKLWPFSPSRAGVEVGYFLGLGIEKGIKTSLPRVSSSVASLAGALNIAAAAPMTPRAPALAGAGAGLGGSIVVHEHHHVHLPGGTALVGMASEVGEAIAPHVRRSSDLAKARRARRR